MEIIKNKFNYLKSSKWLYIIWPYLLLLFVHIIFVANAQQPWIMYDEFIQLGHARYLAGGEPWMFLSETPYAHFGYTLFLVPIFWFFSDPVFIYKAMLIINAVLASALYFPIYYILKNLFTLKKKIITSIAIITCLYPAFVVQSIIVWQDAVIFTFYTTSVALLLYFLKTKTYTSAILFSCSVGFLYMMHVRVLPVLIITVLFLLFLGIYRRELIKKIALGILIIFIFFVVTKLVNEHMMTVMWQGGVTHYSLPSMFTRLTTLAGLKIFFSRIFGQLWYLLQATYGLFFFGLIYLIQYIWQNRKETLQKTLEDKKILTLVYLLLTSLGVFFASVLFTSVSISGRPDWPIYGRYNELFLVPFIFLALVSFYLKKNCKWHYIAVILLIVFTGFLVHQEYLIDRRAGAPINIAGVSLWFFIFQTVHVFIISAITLALILLLKRFFAKKFIYGIFILFILFGMNILVYRSSYFNLKNIFLQANHLLDKIDSLKVNDVYYYDDLFCKNEKTKAEESFMNYNIHNYQWQLPHINFHFLNKIEKETLKYEYIIASACWEPPDNIQAKIIQEDDFGLQAIWKIEE